MIFKRKRKLIKRLLIVEDEPLVAFDNEYLLKSAGYEVVATVDTVEAGVAALSDRIHLAVIDIEISGEGSGIDIATAANERGIAVLFVTGNCPAGATDLAYGCLAKPYNARDLIASIEAIDCLMRGMEPKEVPGLTVFDHARAGVIDGKKG